MTPHADKESAPGQPPAGALDPDRTGGSGLLPFLLALPPLLIMVGRFLPGPRAWGFNHLAYLPGWVFGAWLVAAALVGTLLVPAVQRAACNRLAGLLPRFLFEWRWVRLALPVLAGGLFLLLRERSFFMGDGYLIPELVERGVPFRAFDNLDYLLHFQIYQRFGADGARFSSFDLYRGVSILAGMLAVATWVRLAGALSWSPWRKAAALGLLFLAGPVVLFFGYIESYTFLFLFLTAFLLTGLLVLEGRFPLWLAATFFGLALAFHLTALFTAPALLVLAWRAPGRSAKERIFDAFGPPAALLLVAAMLHIAEGFNMAWFRREFIDAQNSKSIWIPLAQGRGLFTVYHWKDLFNLALITAPVCLLVALAAVRTLRVRAREPRFLFLLVQIASLAFISLAVDRKLGGARDWDLLAAHSAGLILLAAMLLPGVASSGSDGIVDAALPGPGKPAPRSRGRKGVASALSPPSLVDRPHPIVPFALGVSFLVLAPWVVLLHWEDRSIFRFVDVAADFPDFSRGYAYEEVGKYYRKAGDLVRAQALYEKAVATNPSHARIRVLLGSIYFNAQNYDAAEQQYLAAYRIDQNSYLAVNMLGEVAMKRKKYQDAWGWYEKLAKLRPDDATTWEGYGISALRTQRWEEAVRGLRNAIRLEPKDQPFLHEIGIALGQLGRFEEAVQSFRLALARPDARPETRLALAWTRLEMARQALGRGRAAQPEWLDEAEEQLKVVLAQQPADPEALELQRGLRGLRH
jgi:Flp pilus assembly protein TadD